MKRRKAAAIPPPSDFEVLSLDATVGAAAEIAKVELDKL